MVPSGLYLSEAGTLEVVQGYEGLCLVSELVLCLYIQVCVSPDPGASS